MIRGAVGWCAQKRAAAANVARAFVRSQRFGVSPSTIYGPMFYEREVNLTQTASAGDVAEVLIEMFSPRMVIDIGCGNGLYLAELSRRKISAVGCDGSVHGVRLCPSEVFAFQHDLAKPLVVNQRFDLCLCFEVAEHVPKRWSGNVVRSCCNAGETVIFSSASVGQGGTDHINEQPAEFWDALFGQEGFEKSVDSTRALQKGFRERRVVQWLAENARVYVKGGRGRHVS